MLKRPWDALPRRNVTSSQMIATEDELMTVELESPRHDSP
jgi:hypothetical protein